MVEASTGTYPGDPVLGRAAELVASEAATAIPPGWSYNPSAWSQRLPVLVLALINCGIASYLAAVEMGCLHHAWDPFFGSGSDNVLNSAIARAFPFPDALLGACVYAAEAISTALGSAFRWRDRPIHVLLFGALVLPASMASVILFILQPVVVGSWCTLCLVVAALTMPLVAFSLDEVAASLEFVVRRTMLGQPFVQVVLEGDRRAPDAAFIAADHTGPLAGMSVPFTLPITLGLGCWMMIMPTVVHSWGEASEGCYVPGAITIVLTILSMAEVARPLRYLLWLPGLWLLAFAPWSMEGSGAGMRMIEVVLGVWLLAAPLHRGPVHGKYGAWTRFVV